MKKLVDYKGQKRFWVKKWRSHNYGTKLAKQGQFNAERIIDDFKELRIEFKSFLELGCGLGRNIHSFHASFPSASYVGIDVNPDIREYVSKHYPEVLEYSRIIAVDALTFLRNQKVNSFDIIFTYGLLLHITDDVISTVVELMEERVRKAIVIFEREKKTKEDYWRFYRDYEKHFVLPCALKKPYIGPNTLWIFVK